MDETSGTRLVDAVGHNTGILTDVKLGLPGVTRHAYGYNGKSSRAFVPGAVASRLNPGNRDFRYSIWIKTRDKPVRRIDRDWDLFRKGYWWHPGATGYNMEYQPNGQASCSFHGTTEVESVRGGPALSDGKWHKVSCTKTATRIALTVDGRTLAAKNIKIGAISNNHGLVLGAKRTDEFFKGMLDEAVLEMAG